MGSTCILRCVSLVLDGLSKRFGQVPALDGLSFEAPRGQIFGFLGANGAGKTTTMRIILGVLRADSGTIRWGGTLHDSLPRPNHFALDRWMRRDLRQLVQAVTVHSTFNETQRYAHEHGLTILVCWRPESRQRAA